MGKKNVLGAIVFCLLAVPLNLLGAFCARVFVFPLYIDSFATIATAYFFGLLPCILVALLTNLVMTLRFGTPLIFMTCHLMTAIGAWVVFKFSKKKYIDKEKRFRNPEIDLFLIAGLLSAITNGLFGSIYSLTMYNGETEASITPFLMYIDRVTGNMPLSIFWSGFVTNLADKALSAMIAYLLVLPIEKWLKYLHDKNNDNSDKPGNIIKSLFYKISDRSYITTLLLIFLAIANIVSCLALQKSYKKITAEETGFDSSVYVMILASIVLLSASFMIVYAKMIQVKKEKELADRQREWQQKLAFDLHDGVLQNLVALNASLESQLQTEETSSQIQFIKSAASELRFLCGILRLNDEVSFEESLHHTIDAYEKTYGFKIKLGIAADISSLDSNQKVELLRILYECLSNTARHSDAKNVSVTFADDGSGKLYFTVRDYGTATETKETEAFHGLGLDSIRTRAENLGGEVEFSQTTDGWTTRIIVPTK